MILALLTSCGLPKQTRSLFGGYLYLETLIDRHINQNSPVAVDLLVVYKKSTLEKLSALSAAQWFEQRDQIMRDHSDELVQFSWEWVPGQDVPASKLGFDLGAKGGLIFADYFPPGEFRAAINPFQHTRLHLQADGFVVTPLDGKPKRVPVQKTSSK